MPGHLDLFDEWIEVHLSFDIETGDGGFQEKVIEILPETNQSTVKRIWDAMPDYKGCNDVEAMESIFCQVREIRTATIYGDWMLGQIKGQ